MFDDGEAALGYAHRPRVHAPLVARLAPALALTAPVARALDIGCGAGLSTCQLTPFARQVVALDPSAPMLDVAPTVIPGARLVRALAAPLPFRSRSLDLITAAGSLNFVGDLGAALSEIHRVLTPDGAVAVYDFAPGRRITGSDALDAWYSEFLDRWPREPAPTSVTRAGLEAGPLRLSAYEALTLSVPLHCAEYVSALMTESNVVRARQRGEDGASIQRWCSRTLDAIFPGPQPVEFDAWYAVLRPRPRVLP